MSQPFGPFVIVACQDEYVPPRVVLAGPAGIELIIPKDVYDSVRDTLGLPELICPGEQL